METLYPAQQQLVRDLVDMANKAQTRDFIYTIFFGDPGGRVLFRSEPATMKYVSDADLMAVINSKYVQQTSEDNARLTDEAYMAVEQGFRVTPPVASAVTHVTTNNITIHGSNSGNLTQGGNVQVAGVDGERLLAAVRALAVGNIDVLEQADNVAEELNSGRPEKRRLKAYVTTALSHAQKNAPLLNALVGLAKFCGLDGVAG